jgi:hypothetical protein
MMKDRDAGDVNLLGWRAATSDTAFEQTPAADEISEQEYFDHGLTSGQPVSSRLWLNSRCVADARTRDRAELRSREAAQHHCASMQWSTATGCLRRETAHVCAMARKPTRCSFQALVRSWEVRWLCMLANCA